MSIEKKRDFLINLAYWLIVTGAVYLALEHLLSIAMPFLFGGLIAWMAIRLSGKLGCSHKYFRIGLTVLIYGILGFVIILAMIKGISGITTIVQWLPDLYEKKLLPLATLVYEWFAQKIRLMDPAYISALERLLESVLSGLESLISYLSGVAVNLVSGAATGIPNLFLSLLAMIFSSLFVVGDYERITAFAKKHIPHNVGSILASIRIYLTDTLFVVIRSYLLIMALTFTELSILFFLFGIEHPVLKASLIALLDILPILGTGGIMIPWAITSLVLGYTKLGLELLLICAIVTVIRNYVEPKIVGAQLGLHPIITLVTMFVGLRLFGFWGIFGLPVGISFLWKQRQSSKTEVQ